MVKHIPVIAGVADAPTYLGAADDGPALSLSRWRLTELFAKGGVGVSVYQPLATAA